MTVERQTPEGDLREQAIQRLRNKRELYADFLAYLMVNVSITAIWLMTGAGGFFWPAILIFGWGIGVIFHAWNVYWPASPSEDRIDREMHRLAHR
jgi:2TM domain-containing protein